MAEIKSPPYELWGVSDLGGGIPPAKVLPPPKKLLNPIENCRGGSFIAPSRNDAL
jgi:hypothetical protein